jgi:hypothetical protein
VISPEPYRLVRDDDGHSYLVPESKLARFEELCQIVDDTKGDPGKRVFDELAKYTQYAIDNPNTIRFYHWEETT